MDIAFISETHFNNSHDNLYLDNYTIFRKNRVKRKGGGVAIIINNDHVAEVILNKASNGNSKFELLWLKVIICSYSFICGVLYHPPNPSYDYKELLKQLETDIDYFANGFDSKFFILGGDFNGLSNMDIITYTGLNSINKLPTRGSNVLDNLYASCNIWKLCVPVTSNVLSDHKALILQSDNIHNSSFHVASKKKIVKHYRPHGQNLVNKFLKSINDENCYYHSCSNSTQVFEEECNNYFGKLKSILDKYFPMRTITINSSDPVFITAGIKTLLRKKNKLMRNGRIQEAGKISDLIRNMVIHNNATSFNNVNTRKASKNAWKKINSFLKPGNPQLATNFNSDLEVEAKKLNDYFASISCDNSYMEPNTKTTVSSYNTNYNYFNYYDIYNRLHKLKCTAAGPDNIPHWFLSSAAANISDSICRLFNDSIFLSYVPSCFRLATITPIPKIKNPVANQDWRPISVTSILSRTFDKLIVCKLLYPSMLSPEFAPRLKSQFAFRPTGSCEAAIIYLLDRISDYLSSNDYVNLMCLDISKAFDSVSHYSVVEALNDLPIPDELHNWIVSYLRNRMHNTKYNNAQSDFKYFNAGVVQGSGLGPVLFSLVMSTLKLHNPSNCLIAYADDCMILVPQMNNGTLAEEMENIISWASTKNLSINCQKSKLMSISLKGKKMVNVDLGILPHGLAKVTDLVILGVILQCNLSFENNVNATVAKCNKLFYCIRMLRMHGLCITACRDIFWATIVSHITYCINAWKGYCRKSDLDRLSKIYKRGKKLGYFSDKDPTFGILLSSRSEKLFQDIIKHKEHVLYQLLPPQRETKYDMRCHNYGFTLPFMKSPHDTRNFIYHMLYQSQTAS